ncbi:MAG: hypothetical protein QF681_00400, partial [Vicinamibacterales bacterium]|nr:hypothetical protein [Vicinamibacterales bacterium]
MKIRYSREIAPSLVVFGVLLALSSPAKAQAPSTSAGATFYVSADAGSGGDGSRRSPFDSLSQAESASAAGDTIYLQASDSGKVLDGGIALKPRQKLIGVGANDALLEDASDRVRLTNTAALPGGVMVELSEQNEIAGIHFMNMGNAAISGADTDYSGTFIHHATFTGNATDHIEDERGLVYSISFDAASGSVDGIQVEDSSFYDGEDLGAIRVFQ